MMKNWLPALLGLMLRAMLMTPRVCLMGIVHAVGSKLALDVPAGAAGAVAQRAAALDHKAGDDAVERQAVVKALADQLLEIFTGDGSGFLVQLNVDDAAVFHSNANHSCYNTPLFRPLAKGICGRRPASDRDSIS